MSALTGVGGQRNLAKSRGLRQDFPMEKMAWFIRHGNETLGPLTSESVFDLIKEGRITGLHFAWHEGLSKWIRLCESEEFTKLMPPYPNVPTPSKAPPAPAGPTQSEVRRHERAPIRGRILSDEHGAMEIVNISEGGALIKNASLLPVGTIFKFRLESKHFPEPLILEGSVRRHIDLKEFRGFGIEFVESSEDARRAIQEYIKAKIFD